MTSTRSKTRSNSWPLVLGLVISLMVHAGVLAWAGGLRIDSADRWQNRTTPTVDTTLPDVDHPPIGRDSESVARMSWIPDDQFRELIARQFSATDQSAIQREVDPIEDANLPRDPTELRPQPARHSPQSLPTPEQAKLTPVSPQLANPGDADAADVSGQMALEVPDTNGDQLAMADLSQQPLDAPMSQRSPNARGHAQVTTPIQDIPDPQPKVITPRITPTPDQTDPSQNPSLAVPELASNPTAATKSDRESDLFGTRNDPLKVQPGRTLVGDGIEIKTVTPQFSIITRSIAIPADPRVRIVFDADGTVIDAKFIRNTGYDNVDSPILNSLYKWKASGEKLTQRGRGFTMEMEIILR